MEHLQSVNPFTRQPSHRSHSLLVYKFLVPLTYLLVLLTGISNRYSPPPDKHSPSSSSHPARKIWSQNHAHPSPFSLSPLIVDIYWIGLLILQGGYIWKLFRSNGTSSNGNATGSGGNREGELSTNAANLAAHFIVHNLLTFAFIMLWTRSRFIIAEIILILNFFNLLAQYFRHPFSQSKDIWTQHIPIVSGPLSWTFVALFWDGAVMVDAEGLAARILANVAVWGWLVWGLGFSVLGGDWTVGGEMAWLTFALALHQLTIKVVALQWIFAFVIMGLLIVGTLGVVIPGLLGRESGLGKSVSGDAEGDREREREPLLRR